jgi:hypothetical protein
VTPRHISFAAIGLAAIFTAIYVPALGHGFVKDDFRWIAEAEVHAPDDVRRIFASNVGFYRPLVTTSFAIDRAIWGLDPRGYALTNLLLLLADAGLLFALAARLSLPVAAALFAVAVWAFNFHGINMALLWTSGRTALLLCLFAQASALALLRGHRFTAGVLTLAALLCKEEALMLPPLLIAVDAVLRRDHDVPTRRVLAHAWPLWAAAGLYLLLREMSGAFGPFNAPTYYQLTLAPSALSKNLVEYLDRGGTFAAGTVAIVWLASRKVRPFNADERNVIAVGLLWFASMYAITVLLPVRSSLYAVAPSIGSALIAGTFAARALREAPRRFAVTSLALVAGVSLLIPVYRSRNHGLIEPADLAARSLAAIQEATRNRPHDDEITLLDDRNEPVTLDAAFGALFPDAIRLFVGPDARGVIRSAPPTDGRDVDEGLVFVLREGHLVQTRPAGRALKRE